MFAVVFRVAENAGGRLSPSHVDSGVIALLAQQRRCQEIQSQLNLHVIFHSLKIMSITKQATDRHPILDIMFYPIPLKLNLPSRSLSPMHALQPFSTA
jgi:hypothetical protein